MKVGESSKVIDGYIGIITDLKSRWRIVRVNLKSGSEIRSNVPRSEATCHDGEQLAMMESNVPRWVESIS